MYYLSIDLGAANSTVGIVDENFNVVKKALIPTFAEREPEEIIKNMAALCTSLIEKNKINISDIAYAGAAIPGTVNYDTGCVEYSGCLPAFNQFPVVSTLKKYLNVEKIYIENAANAAAKGEALAGAVKGCNHAIVISLGTNVGGGIIIDKKVYSGFNFAGGELGHTVIQNKGRPCWCGNVGCWEAYSSIPALISMTREKMEAVSDTLMHKMTTENGGNISAKIPFDAMRKGDKAAAEVVDMYTGFLGCALTNIINIFQPEVLCISGDICSEGDALMGPVLKIINNEQYTRSSDLAKTQVIISSLGDDAVIIGAAALGL
jgi:glucokinase